MRTIASSILPPPAVPPLHQCHRFQAVKHGWSHYHLIHHPSHWYPSVTHKSWHICLIFSIHWPWLLSFTLLSSQLEQIPPSHLSRLTSHILTVHLIYFILGLTHFFGHTTSHHLSLRLTIIFFYSCLLPSWMWLPFLTPWTPRSIVLSCLPPFDPFLYQHT